MAKYYYKVKNSVGKIISGCCNSSNESDLTATLEKRGYNVICISKTPIKSSNDIQNLRLAEKRKEFSIKEKRDFFTSFLYMYNSGISITDCLANIRNTTTSESVGFFCSDLINELDKGKSFREAISMYSSKNGKAYSAIIGAGDESGKLSKVLEKIIKSIDDIEDIKMQIIQSVVYPLTVAVTAITVFLITKFFVMRIFKMVAGGENFDIIVIALQTLLIIILFWSVVWALGIYCYRNKNIKQYIRLFISQLPVISDILKNFDYINFFSIFSTAYGAGLNAVESIDAAKSVLVDRKMRKLLKKSAVMAGEGNTITMSLAAAGCFPKEYLSTFSAGEVSGKLEEAAARVAQNISSITEAKIKILLKLSGPILLVAVGILVIYVLTSGYQAYLNSLMSVFQ